jgi:peptide-methionine (S)-S-oxide reductase
MNKQNKKEMQTIETAVFGGGCFWCIEAVFVRLKGVLSAQSAYSGGKEPEPDYERVCSGNTGHAEVVKITYDPLVISYEKLLEVFFYVHDPTTRNRQGADTGTQYRSVIYATSQQQKMLAEAYIQSLHDAKAFKDPIVTEVAFLQDLYIAEDYHQDYFSNNPAQPYCSFVVSPKVRKFEEKFSSLLK